MTSLRKLLSVEQKKGNTKNYNEILFLFNSSLPSKMLSGIYVTENRGHLFEIFSFCSHVERNESINILFAEIQIFSVSIMNGHFALDNFN